MLPPTARACSSDTWDGLMLRDIAKNARSAGSAAIKRQSYTGFYRAKFYPDGDGPLPWSQVLGNTATGRELGFPFVRLQQHDRIESSLRDGPFHARRRAIYRVRAARDWSSRTLRPKRRPAARPRGVEQRLAVGHLAHGRLAATGNYVPLRRVKQGDPTRRPDGPSLRVASGKQVAALVGHTDEITGLAFSPDSRMIATAAGNYWHRKDRTVRVWDVATGRAWRLRQPRRRDSLSISLTAERWSLSAWMAWRPSGMFQFHSHASMASCRSVLNNSKEGGSWRRQPREVRWRACSTCKVKPSWDNTICPVWLPVVLLRKTFQRLPNVRPPAFLRLGQAPAKAIVVVRQGE